MGDSVFSILETVQPEVIGDRFSSGGLDTGRAAPLGAFLNSWKTTQFRVGDVNITIPDGSGSPFLFPTLFFWNHLEIDTGAAPARLNAPALEVGLEPPRPGAAWAGRVEASFAGSGLIAEPSTGSPPAIARLNGWGHGAAVTSGPLTDRVGLAVGAGWSRDTQFDRGEPDELVGSALSGFGHLVITPRKGHELRTVGWIQRTQSPLVAGLALGQPLATDKQTLGHVQATWQRLGPGLTWRLFGAYSQRSATRNAGRAALPVFDRLDDGPISDLTDIGDRTDRRWSAGVRVLPAPRQVGSMSHAFHASLDVGGYQARMAPGLSGSIGELVDGSPARLWTYLNSSLDSHRHATTVGAALGDGIELTPRFRVDAAIAYDGVSGSAEGASNGIGWHTLVPSASIRWVAGQAHGIAVVAAYRRAADPLLLDLLAFADPAAPSGSVSSWDGQGSGPLVARVGPGTGGNPGFSTIDGSLARPLTDEYSIGIEARPNPSTRFRLAGVAKRYRPAIDVVNVGAPFTSYAPSAVLDFPAGGVQTLTVYDRQPASFGADRYVLTNPPQEKASLGGVMLTAERSANRLWLLVGATASLGNGPAASRGFHANENDVAAAGELFTNPNAVAFAKGRLFLDRAYTVKIAGIYRFSHDVRLGVILRYQDGQPFSRVLIVPGLNQGAEILRTHPAGDTRFAYTGTLDVRLQKGIVVGRNRIDVVVDAYNVINRGNEVEEDVVTGPAFRSVTAIQPPLAVHLGIRLTFGCPEPPVHPRVLRPNRRLADGAPARP